MKRFLILLIIPLLFFSQSKNTHSFSTFNGSLEQPIGFGVSEINKDGNGGSFWNIKFELGEVCGKSGQNYTHDLGFVINYVANTENIENTYQGLHYGRSTSFLIGRHITIMNNLYLSPGLGFLLFAERAQYNDEDFGGEFYFRTRMLSDVMFSLHLNAKISKRLLLQVGLDIFPDKASADYIHDNSLDRIWEHMTEKNSGLLSNFSFGLGFIMK